ncbi:type II secretion system protein [bacterium]|nr:type II secretion system protein [bacterium]
MKNISKKSAFTLAETLITLSIIGVVSAMTIPALVTKVRHKILEHQFRDTYAIINQAWRLMKADSDYDDLFSVYTVHETGKGYYKSSELRTNFLNYLKRAYTLSDSKTPNYATYADASKKYDGGSDYGLNVPNIVLQNGAMLKVGVSATGAEIYIYFVVDINGLKGPNRAGHDMFLFLVNNSNDTIIGRKMTKLYTEEDINKMTYMKEAAGFPCSVNSKQGANGMGCADFALRNKCPDNPAKTYWDCLPK